MRFVKTVENLFGLPAGFQRVETIESTGTQYIDTGVDAKTGLTIEAKIKYVSHTGIFCGAITTSAGTGDRYYAINFSQQNKVAFTYLDTAFTGSTNLTAGNIYTIKTVLGLTRQEIFVDGVSKGYTTKTDNVDLHWTLGLFALHRGGSFTPEWFSESKAILYYCKIWDGDTLVRDYIPCLDPFGVPCMYDLVGKKPYYNQGTGNFTTGRQIIPVEYLESTGTQYIDTGIIPTSTTETKMGVEILSIPSTFACFGGTDIPNNIKATYAILRKETNESNFNFRTNYNNAIYYSLDTNKKYDIIMNEYGSRNLIVNGDLIGTFTGAVSVDIPIYLFARNSNGTAQTQSSLDTRLYYFSIKDSTGKLVRDYIPCKDENDNGFLFDKVSGVCYLNNGTGNFAFGENKYKTKLRLIKDNILPTGYTQVEYLESTGTQYIDTGVVGASGVKANVKFMWNTGMVGQDKYVLGCSKGSPATRLYFGTYQSKWMYGYGTYKQAEGPQDNTLYDSEISWLAGNQYVKINGTTVITGTTATSYNTGYNLYLPSRNNVGSVGTFTSSAKIYYCKIYNNDILVRSFIPALDPTGTPCMYDMVTKTPFYNQGTGTFSYGKTISMVRFIQDVIPREYAAVNYIESTGTQYIDTGIIGTEGVLSEIDVMKTTATTNECFLGTWNSGSARCWLAYTFSNKWYPGYGGTASDMVQVVQNSWTHIKTYITQVSTRKYFGYNVNGTDYTLTGYFTSFTGQNTILMFAMNTNTGANYKATGRIGTCKITKDGVLVRNFVPVVRRIDKVAGMWDTVTKQFFTTQVGAFNFG